MSTKNELRNRNNNNNNTDSKAKEIVENVEKRITKPSKFKKMIIRTITAIIMVSLFLFVVFKLQHIGVCALIVALQFLIYKELIALRYESDETNNLKWFRTIQWLWFFVSMTYAYGTSWLKGKNLYIYID